MKHNQENSYKQWFRRRNQRLQALLKHHRQHLEYSIGETAILRDRIQKLSREIERYRILTTGEVEDSETTQLLQQQLVQAQAKRAEAERNTLESRQQIRQIIRAQWQLWQGVERLKQRAKAAEAEAPPQALASPQSPLADPLMGHVVPSHKLPNPLRALRDRPRKGFKMTVLPGASAGLVLQAAWAFSMGAFPVAGSALIALTLLWLLPAIFEQLRQ